MSLSTVQIRRKQPSIKRTVESVQEGSGCYLITEPLPLNSKRFILRMRFPFNKDGRLVDVPLGSWGKDIPLFNKLFTTQRKSKDGVGLIIVILKNIKVETIRKI